MAEGIFEYENRHLDEVLDKVDTAIAKAENDADNAEKDRSAIDKNFYNDVRINTSSYSGMMDTAISIRQQQQLLSERENSWQHANKRLTTFKEMKKRPYFARIDFHEKGEKKDETIYIGLASFMIGGLPFLVFTMTEKWAMWNMQRQMARKR